MTQSPEEAAERSKLRRLIDKHHGNVSAIAKELRFTRQAISRHLDRYGLLDAAKTIRFRARVPGKRGEIDLGSRAMKAERRALVVALQQGGYRGAAKSLGVGDSTITRRARLFGITPDEYRRPTVSTIRAK